MFIAGMNFVLSYFALTGKIKKIFQDEEFRFYSRMIIIAAVFVGLVLWSSVTLGEAGAFEHPQVFGKIELFQACILSGNCGCNHHWFCYGRFYRLDTPINTVVFRTYVCWRICWFYFWRDEGSTSLFDDKKWILEFNRALHPNAVLQIRYNKSLVQEKVIQNIYGFFILYMLSFILGALGFSILGLDFVSSIGGCCF